jgi:hypothetical protein
VTLQKKKTCRFGSAHGFGPVFLAEMLKADKKKGMAGTGNANVKTCCC